MYFQKKLNKTKKLNGWNKKIKEKKNTNIRIVLCHVYGVQICVL